MIDKHMECDIVADILPLYLEGKTREDSNEFVEKHLEHCIKCRKNLEYMEISYDEILTVVSSKRKKINRKNVTPFKKARGRIFVCGYLLLLTIFWLYMIFFLFP